MRPYVHQIVTCGKPGDTPCRVLHPSSTFQMRAVAVAVGLLAHAASRPLPLGGATGSGLLLAAGLLLLRRGGGVGVVASVLNTTKRKHSGESLNMSRDQSRNSSKPEGRGCANEATQRLNTSRDQSRNCSKPCQTHRRGAGGWGVLYNCTQDLRY